MDQAVLNNILSKKITLNLRNIYSVLIALVPVIMIFNVPVVNLGVSTVLLGISLPYAWLYKFGAKKTISLLPVILLIGYFCVRSFGNMTELFLLFVVFMHLFGASKGSVNISVARKTVETVAVIGTFCICLQTLFHYLLGVNVSFLIRQLILEENQYYFTKVSSGLYRPSAFFLEPSHYAQYCSIALVSVLFPGNGKKAYILKALWIILGCLLSTSGIGIGICCAVLAWYILTMAIKKRVKLLFVLRWLIVAAIAFVIMMQFSFFSTALQRVFGSVDGYNAIWGRTLYWDSYIGTMHGKTLLLGNGTMNMPSGYMTGLMELIYCYGIIGVGVMLLLFIYLFIKSRSSFARCACVVYCSLMCVANLFGFLSLSYWLCIIISSIETGKLTAAGKNTDSVEKTA